MSSKLYEDSYKKLNKKAQIDYSNSLSSHPTQQQLQVTEKIHICCLSFCQYIPVSRPGFPTLQFSEPQGHIEFLSLLYLLQIATHCYIVSKELANTDGSYGIAMFSQVCPSRIRKIQGSTYLRIHFHRGYTQANAFTPSQSDHPYHHRPVQSSSYGPAQPLSGAQQRTQDGPGGG